MQTRVRAENRSGWLARSGACTGMRGEMEMLARLRAAEREIDVGVATTRAERAAVSAQRFRVYRRWGYYRPGLRVDHELHDNGAIVFLATLRGGTDDGRLVGSARLVLGQPRPGFRFPAQEAFEFAFAGGADFILAGMFDFEIAEDARLVREIFAHPAARQRALQA